MKNGILYFNTGRSCLIRLIVSLYTLRQHYKGVAALIYTDKIEPEYSSIIKEFNLELIKGEEASIGKNKTLLEKCLLYKKTPFENSIFLDADTIVFSDPSELFDLAFTNEFVVTRFSNWLVRGLIAERVLAWKEIFPEQVKIILEKEGPAFNTGVFAFNKQSKFCKEWYKFALQGRTTYIPDEISCQMFLLHYPHIIVEDSFNASCKYPNPSGVIKIMHFHGKKHCRFNEQGKPINNSDLWLKYLKLCYQANISNIKSLKFKEDKMLQRYENQVLSFLGKI